MSADVKAVYEELNFPGLSTLLRVLEQRGIAHTREEVEKLVKGDTARQVQAPAPLPEGKIASDGPNDLWFADLVDLTQAPSADGKLPKAAEKYVLLVQDVFSRFLWGRALKTKQPKEVARAFQGILEEAKTTPQKLTVDKGGEFQADFAALAKRAGIDLVVKSSLRQISTLDSAMGKLKRAMVRDLRRARTDNWASRLQKVIAGQNKVPNADYLEGKAPAAVANDVELRQELQEKNQEYNEHNRERIYDREARLNETGYFRVLRNRPQSFARGFKPIWGEKVHKLASTRWDEVTDVDGNTFKTKFALPVSAPEEAPPPSRVEAGRPAQAEDRKRRVLGSLATEVKRWMGRRTVTLAQVGAFLAQRDFRALALEARLNMKRPTVEFLRAFPERFEVQIDGMGRSFAKILR